MQCIREKSFANQVFFEDCENTKYFFIQIQRRSKVQYSRLLSTLFTYDSLWI